MTEIEPPSVHDEVEAYVRMELRAGYTHSDDIVDNCIDYFTGTYDEELVEELAARFLPEEMNALQNESRGWPNVTDYDRLESAFDILYAKGIVPRENFTCCQTCGMAEIGDELDAERAKGKEVTGFTFFHIQDTEGAVRDGVLYLSYGPLEENERDALAVGAEIVAAFRSVGLGVEWDGTWDKRILVRMNWQRRPPATV